ncbi:MAG: hypothetical protein ACYC77_02215 [Coriobacteriia bacterium]
MRIDSKDISADGKRVVRIRVDRIGKAGERELWWVAEAFDDESTKPEGMFTDQPKAMALAEDLAAAWGVRVVVSNLN